MSHAEITEFLKQKIGMDASTVSPSAIASAVRQRMRATNRESEVSYYALLRTSVIEFQEFIDTVTIPETWFLRDREPFAFLKRYVANEWMVKRRNSVLKVLSLPCSSGEEPYSIAITLIESGLQPYSFQIDGVDVSQKVLQKAQLGIYTKNSFRSNLPEFQSSYFVAQGDEYELQAMIRKTVRFSHGNILDFKFGIDKALAYNVIFCRNLLIYFDRRDRARALVRLHQMLATDGILFVGHSESGQIPSSQFSPIPNIKAYAFRKSAPANISAHPPAHLSHPNSDPNTNSNINSKIREEFQKSITTAVCIPKPIPVNPHTNPQSNLVESLRKKLETVELLGVARKLADRGQFQEAIDLCESELERQPVSVEAHLLLAQIHQAQGNEPEAMQFFQKVLYLNPKHYDAIFHLCLLKEKAGDIVGSSILRKRLEKIQ
jgi:chemotaxis protein methyltransferase WspC